MYNLNPATEAILQTDANLNNVGAWLHQVGTDRKNRAMRSRALTTAGSHYSNIEGECLAVQWHLKKIEYYILMWHVKIETYHAPLEQIFKRNIAEAPARLQRLLQRCIRLDVEVQYKPGRSIPVADAISPICAVNTDEKLTKLKSEGCTQPSSKAATYEINFIEGGQKSSL